MAGLPAGPDTFFSVDPAELAKPECFAVKRGDTEGSPLGGSSYAPVLRHYLSRLSSNPAASKPLSEYADINPPMNVLALGSDATVGFIPMPAVSNNATGEYAFAARPLNDVRKGYTFFANGDILWAKITPSMQNGKSCIVDKLPNGVGFGSTEFHVVRVRDAGVSAKLVLDFISQDSIRSIATRSFTGSAGQQRVPAAFLENLPFPKLSEAQQQEFVTVMDAARAERKAKLAEADALLAGMDDFVLDALGLAQPEKDSKRAFAVRLGQSREQGQLNADFYHPERIRALNELSNAGMYMDLMSLVEVVNFERELVETPDENYLSLAHVESHTGELTDSQEKASGTALMFHADDVLFARLRPYLNKVYHPEMNGTCSTEFLVLRVKDRNTLLPEYLSTILRSRLDPGSDCPHDDRQHPPASSHTPTWRIYGFLFPK